MFSLSPINCRPKQGHGSRKRVVGFCDKFPSDSGRVVTSRARVDPALFRLFDRTSVPVSVGSSAAWARYFLHNVGLWNTDPIHSFSHLYSKSIPLDFSADCVCKSGELTMKRLLLVPSLLALILVGAASAAHAEPVTLVSVGTNTFRGTSAGPYSALLNGSPITMVCLSFDRTVQVGQTWNVVVNSLDASGVANALYGGQANALLKYQRAAWLYDQLTATPNQASAIQGAIWNIFNSSTPDSVASIRWFSAAMNANLEGYDFSRFRILTPTDRSAGGPQENMTTVPEPMTMLLLGSGLLGVAAKVGKRRRLTSAGIAGPTEV